MVATVSADKIVRTVKDDQIRHPWKTFEFPDSFRSCIPMCQLFSTRHSFSLLACMLFITAVGCGTRITGFLTPVYRIPPGYSETYRKAGCETAAPQSQIMTGDASHGPYFSADDNSTLDMKKMESDKTGSQSSPREARSSSLFESSKSNNKTK
jgi:hypothetical protein